MLEQQVREHDVVVFRNSVSRKHFKKNEQIVVYICIIVPF